jgi:hypothetical protein
MALLSRSFIHKGLISLGTVVSISVLPFAMAEDQTSARHVPAAAIDSGDQRFTLESDLAISTMSLSMSADSTGDVDRDFAALMIPHHQAAIDIARAELKYGHNEKLPRLAQDIIIEREREMSAMQSVIGKPPPAQTSDTPSKESNSERPSNARSQE